MVDVARLGLAVDSAQVEKGTATLHQLTGAAGQASAAAQRLAGASQAEAAGHKAAAAATQVHTAAIHANNRAMALAGSQRANLIFQLNDIGVSLASGMNPLLVAVQQGSQIATIYGPGGIGKAISETGNMAAGAATKFAPFLAVLGAGAILLQGMTNEINAVSGANVSMVDTTIAVFQSIADGVQMILLPAFGWFSKEWDNAVNQIYQDTAREVNAIIGLFVGAVDAIKAVWGVLPDALGYVAYEAGRNVVNAIVTMVQDVQASMNDLFNGFDSAIMSLGGQAMMPRFNLEQTRQSYVLDENPYASAGGAVAAAGDAFSAAQGKDYVGDWMKDIGARAEDIARARAETEELGSAAEKANKKVAALASEGLELVKSALSGIGSGLWGAIREGGDILGNIFEMLMSKVDNLIGKLLDKGIEALLFGTAPAGGGAAAGGLFSWIGSLFGFATGGVFNAGQQVQAFAKGGVVDRPTLFPMAKGAGLMGEAGPEAVMPLKRTSDGRLGVATTGQGSGGGTRQEVDIRVGIATDGNGNLTPFVQKVARGEVRQATPGILSAAGRQTKGVMQAINQRGAYVG